MLSVTVTRLNIHHIGDCYVCWVVATKVSTEWRDRHKAAALSRAVIFEKNIYLRAVLIKVDKVQAFVQIRI